MIVNAERQAPAEDRARGDANQAATFYMKQSGTLDNACGIIACLHAIFNNQNNGVEFAADSVLGRFWNQVKDMNPQQRCEALEGADEFKQVHSGFAAQGQSSHAQEQADVKHHFTDFVLNDQKQLSEYNGA